MEVKREKSERRVREELGGLVQTTRKKRGYSLKELSALTGISTSYLSRIETFNSKSPTLSVIIKLSEGLDLEVFDLIKVATGVDIKSECKREISLEELILNNDFSLNGEEIEPSKKMKIIRLLERVSSSELEYKTLEQLEDIIREIAGIKKD